MARYSALDLPALFHAGSAPGFCDLQRISLRVKPAVPLSAACPSCPCRVHSVILRPFLSLPKQRHEGENRQHSVTPCRERREARLPANADQHATFVTRPPRRPNRADMLPTPTPTAPEGADISRHGCAHATQHRSAGVHDHGGAHRARLPKQPRYVRRQTTAEDRRRRSVTTQRSCPSRLG
jgi:hypothetical protein